MLPLNNVKRHIIFMWFLNDFGKMLLDTGNHKFKNASFLITKFWSLCECLNFIMQQILFLEMEKCKLDFVF